MKSVYFILIVCVVYFASASNLTPETTKKFEAASKEISTKCLSETGATEDDLKSIKGGKVPTNKEGKCLISCSIKAAGLKYENGVLTDKNGFLDLIKTEDPDYYKTKMKVNGDCYSEVKKIDDDCEYHTKMFDCILNKSKAANIPFSVFSL